MLQIFTAWALQLRPSSFPYGRFALTLLVGILGALVFVALRIPLPWMLGPLVFATLAALVGAPVAAPNPARAPMIVVLGVLMGVGISPELISRVPLYLPSLGSLAAVILASTAACYGLFRLIGKLDRTTAFYSSVPGGLTEMILMGEVDGGNPREIATIHAGRILFVILVVPFFVQVVSGAVIAERPPPGTPILALSGADLSAFALTCVLGAAASTWVKTPISLFLVPLLLSGFLHASGVSSFQPPTELVLLAQLVVGLGLGSRFSGARFRDVRRPLILALAACAVLLAIASGFAVVVSLVLDTSFLSLLLAYSPGGVAEMSLVALALHMDAAFVVLHHLARLLLVTLCARPAYLLLCRFTGHRNAQG